ncbi:MAG TPA: anthranilate phosphoribosyltransferase [Bryobacteraceae bacterium]|nr:anthranilate phosphoribosyltransferase [Bryobacteraceae bacterium]
MTLLPYLHRICAGENLPSQDAEQAMALVLSGEVSTPQIAAFLVALRMKGETAGEVLGFARAMRAKASRVNAGTSNGDVLLDTCGTGGDGTGTFNISTIAAFVVAATGVWVAKHGNRAISSQCGSADILEALGVNIHLNTAQMGEALRKVGISFLFAPAIHPAMKHAQAARTELKMRTVFNLLGPLTNPAGATVQLVGSHSFRSAELMAEALANLGIRRGFVVHGADGLDEITTTGETIALEIQGGAIAHHTLTPDDFGLRPATREALQGGDRVVNCQIAEAVLEGSLGPHRDIVLANASAALVAAGKAPGFREGVSLAAEAIDSGAAKRKARELAEFSRAMTP